jgi:hypothetical protein
MFIQGLTQGLNPNDNYLTIKLIGHNYTDGWGPFYIQSSTVDPPAPLVQSVVGYYAVVRDKNHINVASSQTNAILRNAIKLTDAGTGIMQWIASEALEFPTPLVFTSTFTTEFNDSFILPAVETLIINDGPFRLTTTGTLPGGLLAGTDYYIINGSGTELSFGLTRGGANVALSDDGVGVHTMTTTAGALHYEPVPTVGDGTVLIESI